VLADLMHVPFLFVPAINLLSFVISAAPRAADGRRRPGTEPSGSRSRPNPVDNLADALERGADVAPR